MTQPKPGKARKRPSARRASPATPAGEPSSGAAAARPKKRVSARRGQRKDAPTGASAEEAGHAPRKPKRAARRKPPQAPAPVEAPTPASATPVEAEPVVAPPEPATRQVPPSIAPPGEPVADDAWETVAEGTPQLAAFRSEGGSGAPAALGGGGLRPSSRLTTHSQVAGPRHADALGSARAVLGADYYYEQWGREGLRRQELDVDGFGLDPHFEARMRPWLAALVRRYFRLEIEGAQNLPVDGRALLVSNRSGLVPWDGLLLKEALRTAAPRLPALRWLTEDSVFYYPFLGVFMNRMGAVRACPENAERLLGQSSLVAVFPEGARGGGKLFRERHRLERFGRGGYVRLALRNSVPVYPVAIVGGEEAYPMLARSKLLGQLLGTRYAPITPTFPALGLAGLLPAPAKWRIRIGEPLAWDDLAPAAADDSLVVHRLNDQVRRTLQGLLEQTARARGPAYL